jgi:alkaline phosphatase
MKAFGIIFLALTILCVCVQAGPNNVIFFIGDGMGYEQVYAASCYVGQSLPFEEFPYKAECTTYSANSSVTDSAAAGTALATGFKVNNDVISMAYPGDGSELLTLLEEAQANGKSVALVTTTYLTHATPACFGAHEPSRNNFSNIANDYLNQTRPNVLFGGGGNGLTVTNTQNAGYVVVTDSAGFSTIDTTLSYLSAQFGSTYMPYKYDYLSSTYPYPSLAQMVQKAIDAVDDNPNGFFLMVEGGLIDQACHGNYLERSIHETIDFYGAVQTGIDWANGRSDTLIVITADHETGGLTVVQDNGVGNYPTVTWSTTGHTGANVPVYAWGQNAELVSGIMDNTEMFDLCTADANVPPGRTKNIMLTGYWPPTNEMLREFSQDPNQNPGVWVGENWEGHGYDVYAFFPEFPGGTGSNPKGNGDFEVDYQDVGSWTPPSAPTGDFWRITGTVHPVAIMSYGQGTGPWEMEYNARNLPSASWTNDYLSPTKPTPVPPDITQASGYVRHSSLPMEAIAEAVNSSGTGINAWIDWDGNPGNFLCEYMAYHNGWYQSLHSDPCDPYYCVGAGFTHLASGVTPSNGASGVKAALRALITHLDLQLDKYTISGTVTSGGSGLAGVTMYGLPGNPVTNSSGVYTAQVGGGWSGIVTPLKSGYAITQQTYSNVRADKSSQNYTASAATADTITLNAASSKSSSTAGTTLSWSHTVGSGNNRVLVVSVVTEDSTASDQRISSVKFNGVNMTAVPGSTKFRTAYSGSSYSSTLRTDLYYMLNPPVGTYTVLITCNGSVSYRAGGAVSLNNVKQQVPEAIAASSATSASISTSIDVPNIGAWIVDVVGHSNSGSFTSSTTTERLDRNSGQHTIAGGTKAVTTSGSNTITWTFSGSSGAIVHSLAVFAPSETSGTPPPSAASSPVPATGATNVSLTQDLSWTAGSGAVSHDVYFGTVNPPPFIGNQAGTTYDTETMTVGGTYYWRIDEKNAGGTTTGAVWSFATISIRTLTSSSTTGGDVTTPGEGAFQYNHDTVVDIAATADAHYHFVNWTGSGVAAGKVANPNLAGTTITMDGDYTVVANFAIDQYNINASAGSGGSINPTSNIIKDYGSSQLFTAAANLGYEVDKWSVDGVEVQTGGTTYTLSNITAAHTVAVSFKIFTYTVSASAGVNGSIDPVGDMTKDYGSSQLFTATADPIYKVDKWSVDGVEVQTGGTTYTLSNITATHTVAVSFKILTYTVSASAGNGGSINPAGNIVKDYDSSQLFTAAANLGYEIDKWMVDGVEVQTGGTTYTLSNIKATHTVAVSFKIFTYTVSASAGNGGSINPAGNIIKDYGSSQLFTATANLGYEVDKWSVDGVEVQTGGTTYTLSNITAPHTVAVSFKVLTYTVSASAGANGSINPVSDIIKDYGSSQLFTATADPIYEVDKWMVDGVEVQTGGTTYTLSNITAAHIVTVSFKIFTYTVSASAGTGGSIDPAGDIIKDYGSSQLFTATANTGYTVDKWSVDSVEVQTGGTTYTLSNITAAHIVAVTFAAVPPARATAPSPSAGATNVSLTADISWTSGSGASSHDVYFGTTNPPPFIQNQAGTTYDTGTMVVGATYYWRIDEKNAGGTTTGIVWSFTTVADTQLLAPTNVSATDRMYTDKIQISWTDPNPIDSVTSFEIWRNTKNQSNKASKIADVLLSPYDDTQVQAGTTYFYWVKAKNSAGISDFSIGDSGRTSK